MYLPMYIDIDNIPSKSCRIHILFKCTWNFSKIDDMLDHKTSLSKFKKKIEILSSVFSNHNIIRLEINYKTKKNAKKPKQTKPHGAK